MFKYEVGKLYKDNVTRYAEGTKFDFTQSGAVLELYFERPSNKEIEDVKSGKFELGFYEKEDILFMLFKFGTGSYLDTPYSVHLSQPFQFMDLDPGFGFGLSIFLIDASTGILKAIRYVGLSNDFSQRFKKAVERQKRSSFDVTLYDQKVQSVYTNYSTKDLVLRAEAWCKIK